MLHDLLNLLEITTDGEITAPFTFMYDSQYYGPTAEKINFSGISAVFFNYNDLITESVKNQTTKGFLLRDCWGYGNIFDPNWEGANN